MTQCSRFKVEGLLFKVKNKPPVKKCDCKAACQNYVRRVELDLKFPLGAGCGILRRIVPSETCLAQLGFQGPA